MAFGVLFDFTGNTNVTKITPADKMIQQDWFLQAINSPAPIDVFIIIGHNPARETRASSTLKIVQSAIRAVHPNTPIQMFGGHSHLRDFVVYDESSTASESGRYCETLGWFSMSGFNPSNSNFSGPANPKEHPDHPNRKTTVNSTSPFLYSRRYLDWNRLTFEYHAPGSQVRPGQHSPGPTVHPRDDKNRNPRDEETRPLGLQISNHITAERARLGLGKVLGCTPKTYCVNCVPFMSESSLYTFLAESMAKTIINSTRAHIPRLHISNTGMARFDLHRGPFTYDDNFIISPFPNPMMFIPEVKWSLAKGVLDEMNRRGAGQGRRGGEKRSLWYGFDKNAFGQGERCENPGIQEFGMVEGGRVLKKRTQEILEAGYTTEDDFGTDGDDTLHTSIQRFELPPYFATEADFPEKREPEVVDLVFNDLWVSLPFSSGFLFSDILRARGFSFCLSYFVSQNFLLAPQPPFHLLF